MGWKCVSNDHVNASTELLVTEWCWGRAAGAAEPGRRSGSSWLETGILTHCLDPGKSRELSIEIEKLSWTLLFLSLFDASIMTFNITSIDKNCAKKFFECQRVLHVLSFHVHMKCFPWTQNAWPAMTLWEEKNCYMLWSALLNMHAMANISIKGFILTYKLWMASLRPKNTNLC